jgi:hypothetical protein
VLVWVGLALTAAGVALIVQRPSPKP